MGWLANWWNAANAVPNATVSVPDSVGPTPTYSPGDPDGFEFEEATEPLSMRTAFVPSPWDGWPASWSSPEWNQLGPKFDQLVDTAWAALDLNSSRVVDDAGVSNPQRRGVGAVPVG